MNFVAALVFLVVSLCSHAQQNSLPILSSPTYNGATLGNAKPQTNEEVYGAGRGSVLRFMTKVEIDDVQSRRATIDVTAAIQTAMDSLDHVTLPPGTYKVRRLYFKRNSQVVMGSGFGNTILLGQIDPSGGSIFSNINAAITLIGNELHDIKLISGPSNKDYVLDWTSMQHGVISRVGIFGNGSTASGIKLAAKWGVTDSTYNSIIGCYIGGTIKGIFVGDGANSNTFINNRIQPLPGGHSYYLLGSGVGRVSNNLIEGGGTEYPGIVSNGIFVGLGTKGTTISTHRFESLLVGVYVASQSENTVLLNNYFDSSKDDVVDLSESTIRIDASQLQFSAKKERAAVFDGVSGKILKTQMMTLVKNNKGDYTLNFTKKLKSPNPKIAIAAAGVNENSILSIDDSHIRFTISTLGTLKDSTYISVSVMEF